MIYREHYIELFINGHKADIESQKSLNLRFNNILYDPAEISSTQAEYSFEISLPSTPNNDKIFDYANNLSKLNKFTTRYAAEVYADGISIFEGSLVLNSYKEKQYNCNLVSVKVYSLEEIFGDAVLTDIPWYTPFEGAGNDDHSINWYNSQLETDVVFPLVSYGAFQKSPYYEDDAAKDYTSKFDLDKYNRWYVESFYPSLKMLETVKKAFEYKGYTVGGDAFQNKFLNDIYMSCNLADGQIPEYNLGNPKFGQVSLSTSYSTSQALGYEQELQYPYFRVHNARGHFGGQYQSSTDTEAWNFSSVRLYDILSSGVTVNAPSYLYQPNEHLIVIPADGYYKIDLSVDVALTTSSNLNVDQEVISDGGSGNEIVTETISLSPSVYENMPIEIALVRNYDDNYELIKGKMNKQYKNGNPASSAVGNAIEWQTCYPHEDIYNATYPTVKNDLTVQAQQSHFGGMRGAPVNNKRKYSKNELGYVFKTGEIMAYDPAVSDAFICGFSTIYGGIASVRKNGYSWSKSYSENENEFYKNTGYLKLTKSGSSVVESATTYNKNEYISAPTTTINCNSTGLTGSLSCMVYLRKDDVLNLFAVHRAYWNGSDAINYNSSINVSLDIKAATKRNYFYLKQDNYGYYSPIEFDYDLRLTNFLNKETLISDWLQNIFDAFNLETTQNGKNIWINTKKKLNWNLPVSVDIDDRVNSRNAESQRIDYPKSMAVKYKINTDEWGFERSVYPPEKLNDPDWKDYGDSGFTEIILNNDEYVTKTSDKQLQFSYTWYDNFNWYAVDSSFNQSSGNPVTLTIPVIAKSEYMLDGYDYTDSMKHDGYGLAQRFWFRPRNSGTYVYTRTYPVENVQLYEPLNLYTNYRDVYLNLSYKVTEPSLLTEYFNITPYLSSNYVIVDVYLTPEEYKAIKNGCAVAFDSDVYLPVEINGYDASGQNPTELKLLKKI